MTYNYVEVLTAEREVCDYLEGNSKKDLSEIFKPIEFYFENEKSFEKEEIVSIERGLARIVVTFIRTKIKK